MVQVVPPRFCRVLAPVLALAAACLAGCGTVSAGSTASPGSAAASGLEKTVLNVAAVPSVDSAGFFVALHEGLFAKEGLTIHYTPATSSDTVINEQVNGEFDITAGNYVSYIQHAVYDHQALDIVAEGSLMQQGSQALYALPASKITSLKQLQGHVIGINAPGNINYLLISSVLTENGISPKDVAFTSQPIPFPTLISDLAAKKVSVVALPEPFASMAEQKLGAVVLSDMDQGATQNFPILGYVATKAWAQRNPNTLKAFLAALEQGQEIADTSRVQVEKAMESLGGAQDGQVPPIIAAVMAFDNYPLGVNRVRLQRVANVMFQFGLLKQPYNIAQMIGS